MYIANFVSLTDGGCLQSSFWSCGLLIGHITSLVHPGAQLGKRWELMTGLGYSKMIDKRK